MRKVLLKVDTKQIGHGYASTGRAPSIAAKYVIISAIFLKRKTVGSINNPDSPPLFHQCCALAALLGSQSCTSSAYAALHSLLNPSFLPLPTPPLLYLYRQRSDLQKLRTWCGAHIQHCKHTPLKKDSAAYPPRTATCETCGKRFAPDGVQPPPLLDCM